MAANTSFPEEKRSIKLVLSYRRAGASATVGRLQDWLEDEYGADGVYRDIDDIPLARDFREELRREIEGANALLVVIGPGWLTVKDENGVRRLDNENDPVRIEIEAAIQHGIAVVPLYVNGASPPAANQLPDSLQPLVYAQGQPIRDDPDFRTDMRTLLRRLSDLVSPPSEGTVETGRSEGVDRPPENAATKDAKQDDSTAGRSAPTSSEADGGGVISIAPYVAGVVVVLIIVAIVVIVITA